MSISPGAKQAISVIAIITGLVFAHSAQAEGVDCRFISTRDNKPLQIKIHEDDTPEAKEFYKTCKNPYTKRFANDPGIAWVGKRKFGYYSCTKCHGQEADVQPFAPSIVDDRWQYAKHITDKGMFETIAGGTANGEASWHRDVTNNPVLMTTDDILKIIGWLRSIYCCKSTGTPWMDEKP